MADFAAALGALKRGLRVRREGWRHNGIALAIDNGKLTAYAKALTGTLSVDGLHADDILATDWEHIPE